MDSRKLPKSQVLVISLALLALLTIACTFPQSDWQRWEAYGAFSLSLPPDWEVRKLKGTDSSVGEIVGDDVHLTFDYGPYSSTLVKDNELDYIIRYQWIDGKKAKLVHPVDDYEQRRQYRTEDPTWFRETGLTGVYFERLHPGVLGDTRLEVSGWGLTKEQQETAFTIFKTIRFTSSGFAPDLRDHEMGRMVYLTSRFFLGNSITTFLWAPISPIWKL